MSSAATAVVFAIVAVGWLCAPNAKTWRCSSRRRRRRGGGRHRLDLRRRLCAGRDRLAGARRSRRDMWATPSRFRIVAPLLMAVLASPSAPMICNYSFGSGAPKILGFWIYPSLGFIEPTTVGGKIAHIVAFWLMLLPLRIGLVYVLAFGNCAGRRRSPIRHNSCSGRLR